MLHLASTCLAKAANGGGGCAHSSGFRRVFTPPLVDLADVVDAETHHRKPLEAIANADGRMHARIGAKLPDDPVREHTQVGERVEVAGACSPEAFPPLT